MAAGSDPPSLSSGHVVLRPPTPASTATAQSIEGGLWSQGPSTGCSLTPDQIRLRFQPGTFRRYSEEDLGHQLSELVTRTWVDYQRNCFAALSEEIGETVRGDERSYSPKMVEYGAALAAITARGSSRDGWIDIVSTGLIRWRVHVHDGACARLAEEEFIAEVYSALRNMFHSSYAQQRDVQEEFRGARRADPANRG